ncbi:MAG: 3-demethylubiquinone-9 3-O-methyltransferase [Proteobacteria bacterium]|nr:3-demethylubiquinone-9 3-O-methyltransferase [Pseudomonadota bacterium]
MAKEGAKVTGLDASAELIEAARVHGKGAAGLSYRQGSIEEEKEKFDVVVSLEVIEHVNDPAHFVKNCAKAMDKKGLLIFSTPNRTPKGFLFTIVGAEYVLRWIPRGTHSFAKFIRPSELSNMVKAEDLTVRDICGVRFSPLSGRFSLDAADVEVDYFLSAAHPQE